MTGNGRRGRGGRDGLRVRPARARDLPALARLGVELARAHHGWDPRRFLAVADDMEEGYAWWLGREMGNPAAVVLAAARGARVIGYAYGRIEPRDWNTLRDRCGYAVDLVVEEAARGGGLGTRLLEELCAALAARGAPRVVLHAAWRNRAAQRLFRARGFRPTMVEMTREADPAARGRRRSGGRPAPAAGGPPRHS